MIKCDLGEGDPNVPLTHPLFCSFSYLRKKTERQHTQVCRAIVNHLRLIENWMLPQFSDRGLNATMYIEGTHIMEFQSGQNYITHDLILRPVRQIYVVKLA